MISTTSKVLLAIGPPAPNARVGRNAALALMARSSPTRSRSPWELRDRAGELRDRYRPTGGNFVIVNTRLRRRQAARRKQEKRQRKSGRLPQHTRVNDARILALAQFP